MNITLLKKKIHWKKVNWKYVSYWVKETIKDLPELIYCLIRMHYIAIISCCISIYFYPLKFFETGEFQYALIGGVILFLGVGFDISRNNRGII